MRVEAVTPSGIEIRYQAKPRRTYWIRPPVIGFRSAPRDSEDGWLEVPSVTTVLDVLDKPALPYWGNRIGVEGVVELIARGLLVFESDERSGVA